MKLIFESIENIFKPKSHKEILNNFDLTSIDGINKALIYSIQKLAPYSIIKHLIEIGANQLWWQIGGTYGGRQKLEIPQITENIVKIVNIGVAKKQESIKTYEQTPYKIVYRIVWPKNNYGFNHVFSSQMFYKKYEPIDIDLINSSIKNLNEIKNLK